MLLMDLCVKVNNPIGEVVKEQLPDLMPPEYEWNLAILVKEFLVIAT